MGILTDAAEQAERAADAAEHAAEHAERAADAATAAVAQPEPDAAGYAAAGHEHDGYALRAYVDSLTARINALEAATVATMQRVDEVTAEPEPETEAVVEPPAPEPEPPAPDGAKTKKRWFGGLG